MAAPVAGKIILPLDTGNTGKNVRTQTRTVGADSVHEHFMIPISSRSRTGIYMASSGVITWVASQNGTSTGAFWLYNPVGSSVKMAIRRIRENIQFTVTSAVDVSVPRVAFNRITFTGTNSGTLITPAKRDSTDAANVGQIATTSATWVVTLGAQIRAIFPPIMPTATSATIQGNQIAQISPPWDLDEDEMPVLRAGEGIVCYFPDAATTTNRRLIVDVIWEEFE